MSNTKDTLQKMPEAKTGSIDARPIKKQVSLRLDADVLEWFKNRYLNYQVAINAVLRQYIQSQQRGRAV